MQPVEVKATQVEGTDNEYEFTQIESGQPFVVEDSSGRVVLRDRGSIRFHVVFDTGGDDVPGGEFVDFLGLEVRGPHPGFYTEFCRVAGDLVGISDASQRYTLHPEGTTTSHIGYAEYLPPTYGDGKSPLLVFLHGAGESGDGSAEQLGNLCAAGDPQVHRERRLARRAPVRGPGAPARGHWQPGRLLTMRRCRVPRVMRNHGPA